METREGFPFAFACARSGNCCAIPGGIVRITADEARSIADHLGMTVDAFASRYLQPDGVRLKEGLGTRCVFLRDGGQASCGIYPVRPQRCRSWPFWPELRADPDLLRLVQRTCPGIAPLEDAK